MAAEIDTAPQTDAPRTTFAQRVAVLIASILGSSMAFVNGTAVTLALDPIQSALDASLGEMLWVASIYMLFISALMLIGGAIGDFYGRRATFVAGVFLFTLASLGCAAAPNPEILIIARAAQGMGAALLTPMSLTLLSDAFSRESRGAAIGLWSLASAVMTAIGPPVGGWLAEFASWRTIFLLPVPFGILCLLISVFLVPKRPPPRVPESIDWAGALFAFVGFSGIAYGLISLSDAGRSVSLTEWGLPAGIGLLSLLALVIVERNAKSPMAPPALFRIGTFNAINTITFLLYGAMGGIFVFYPIVLTDAYGFGMSEIGLAFLGFALPMIILTPLSPLLGRKLGVRTMLAIGSLVGVAAFGSMGLAPYAGTLSGVFFSITIFGAGIAIVVPGMNAALFNATPEDSHGAASGINNASARAATLFAIAGYGAAASYAFHVIAGPAATVAGYAGGDDLVGPDLQNYQAAMIFSFEVLAYLSIALCFLSFLVAVFFIEDDRIDPDSLEDGHLHEEEQSAIRRMMAVTRP